MTRAEYIELVKVKMEEISPFEEPVSFIASEGDVTHDKVKPIVSYIDATLDEATHDCLSYLPTLMLASDLEHSVKVIEVDDKGVGILRITKEDFPKLKLSTHIRPVKVFTECWERPCTVFIKEESQEYLLQKNRWVRGGTSKPVVAYIPNNGSHTLELYSIPKHISEQGEVSAELWYINTRKKAEDVLSDIHECIALKCASKVYGIMNNADYSAYFEKELNEKINMI